MVLWSNRLVIIFACITNILIITGCKNKEMILEKKFIFNLKVIPQDKNNRKILLVSGLCGHSAYGIKDITYKQEKDKLIMLIQVAPNHNGNFTEKIILPDSVNELLLGTERNVIWGKD